MTRQILFEGRFVRLVRDDHWEWAERTNTACAVVIVAVTRQREIVLTEQYRIPLAARVVELPAGLVGDLPHQAAEDKIEAARRELLEETGFASEDWQPLVEGPVSAGMSNELAALYLARNVWAAGKGGGDASESIEVHVVHLDRAEQFLADRRRQGALVDPKVYAGLYFAQQAAGRR